jgi:hypothetical protein
MLEIQLKLTPYNGAAEYQGDAIHKKANETLQNQGKDF